MVMWRLVALEARSSLRTRLPNTIARRTVVGGMALVLLTMCILVATVAPASPRVAELSVGSLFGLVSVALLLAATEATSAAAMLLRQPERLRLGQLAPLRERSALLLSLSPLILIAVAPLVILLLPLAILVGRAAPVLLIHVAVLGSCALAWAITVSLALVTGLAARFGRERACRIAGGLSGVVGFAALLLLGKLVTLRINDQALLLFVAGTAFLLPWMSSKVARSFAVCLRVGERSPESCEPRWGRIDWLSLLARTPAPWLLAASGGLVLLATLTDLPLRHGLIALAATSSVLLPIACLFEPEDVRPMRWEMSPYAGGVQASMLLRVGGTLGGLALVALAGFGWGRWSWLAASTALTLACPPAFLLPRFWRRIVHIAISLLALLTQALA